MTTATASKPMPASPTSPTSATITALKSEIALLNTKRCEIRDQLLSAHPSRVNTAWYQDRVRELEVVNRSLTRGIIRLGGMVGE